MNNQEQRAILKFLTSEKGGKFFPLVANLHPDVVEDVFNDVNAKVIYKVLRKMWKEEGYKTKTLPSKEWYNSKKMSVPEYSEWYTNGEDVERLSKIQEIEGVLYHGVQRRNESTLISKVLEVAYNNFLTTEFYTTTDEVDAENMYVDIYTAQKQRIKKFERQINSVIGNTKEKGRFVVTETMHEPPPDGEGLKSFLRNFEVYPNSLHGIIAPPKAYKSGLIINLMWHYVEVEGMHIPVFDLENGLDNYYTRIIQRALKIPKNWVTSGVYYDKVGLFRDHNLIMHEELQPYSAGDLVYKVSTQTHTTGKGFKGKGKNKITGYTHHFNVFKCSQDGNIFDPYSGRGWEKVNMRVPLDNYSQSVHNQFFQKMTEVNQESGGQILIKYLSKPKPSDLIEVIRENIEQFSNQDYFDPEGGKFTQGFLTDEARRLCFVDWVSLLRGDGSNISEQTNSIYKDFKSSCQDDDMSYVLVEGTTKTGAFSSENSGKDSFSTKGSSEVPYHHVLQIAIRSDVEGYKKGLREIVPSQGRYMGSNYIDFGRIKPTTQEWEELTPEQYKKEAPHRLDVVASQTGGPSKLPTAKVNKQKKVDKLAMGQSFLNKLNDE